MVFTQQRPIPSIRRLCLALIPLSLLASRTSALAGQVYQVSGVVVDGVDGAPVAAATVRLPGYATISTASDGSFGFADVAAGHYAMAVTALGYQPLTAELNLRSDTTLRLELEPDPVPLDTLAVTGATVSISGTVRDSATGLILLQGAAVTVFPMGRTVDAQSGRFTLDRIPRGERVGLLVEALEYLPARIEIEATRDTAIHIRMNVDSVGMRLIQQQVERLNRRSNGIPHSVQALNRDAIMRAGVATTVELLRRRLPPGTIPPGLPYSGSTIGGRTCILLDDMLSSLEEVAYLPPTLIERVEVVGYRGRMIRVYTRRYVARLMRVKRLQPITFMDNGLGSVCR